MGPTRILAVLLILLPAAGCGGKAGGSGGGRPPCTPHGTTLHLTARSTRFSADCLAVPAGVPFTVNLDNQDAGVQHSFGIFDKDPTLDSSATEVFAGARVTGTDMKTYAVGPLPSGTFHFRCDVHPQQMFGTLLVGG